LGCYRTGEANDPEVYISAVTHILAQYPEDVMRAVSDPLTGLPVKIEWLPKLKEVLAACEEIVGRQRRLDQFSQRSEQQLRERDEREREDAERTTRPTLDEIKTDLRARGIDLDKKREQELAERDDRLQRRRVDANQKEIERAWAARGEEPRRAGGLLISPSLVECVRQWREPSDD
jgi:hypothetical protein